MYLPPIKHKTTKTKKKNLKQNTKKKDGETSKKTDERQPPADKRQLISRRPSAASPRTPGARATASAACPKCGAFAKSGRASCCAPGGAWYKNCGAADNENVVHMWSEGTAACKRKCNTM